MRPSPRSTLFPYTTLFRSHPNGRTEGARCRSDLSLVATRMTREHFQRLVVEAIALIPKRFRREMKNLALVDRKSTRLNSSHGYISYAVFCLKKKTTKGLGR